MKVYQMALVDVSVLKAPVYSRFQFERIGYFCVDPLSTTDKVLVLNCVYYEERSALNKHTRLQMVFNQTVTLKENPANPAPISNS